MIVLKKKARSKQQISILRQYVEIFKMISVFDDEYSMENDCSARNPTPNVWQLLGDFRSALHHVKANSEPGTGYGNFNRKRCLLLN